MKKIARPLLSIVMPVHNEEGVIESVIRSFHREVQIHIPGCEFLIFEDGSDDKTKTILRRLQKELPIEIHLCDSQRGYFQAAKDAILAARGEWIFFADSDGQYLARDFWPLWKHHEKADLICGSRRQSRQDPPIRLLLSGAYNVGVNFLFQTGVTDTNAGFKLMRHSIARRIVPAIRRLPYGFSTELIVRARKAGYRLREIPIGHAPRRAGQAEQFIFSRLPKVAFRQIRGLCNLKREIS